MPTPDPPAFIHSTGNAYDRFMGRYSRALAPHFADHAGIDAPMKALDVGCGTGAMLGELVHRLGAESVTGCDPSDVFVEVCQRAFPDVDIVQAAAEKLPFSDRSFDATLAQLVIHFVKDPQQSMSEMKRVTRSGGIIGCTVWDRAGGMELFKHVSAAARSLGGERAGGRPPVPFSLEGELDHLFVSAGLADVSAKRLTVSATYSDFDDLWSSLETAAGTMAALISSLSADELPLFRTALREGLGNPAGAFTLNALAFSVIGAVP